MRSSARFASKPAARRALLIGSRAVAVYHWSGAETAAAYLFNADDEGREQFARYLRETDKAPFFALVDVFEEEYRHETIPHVLAADRAAIVKRKAARLFRDSPYYCYRLLGREAHGRRDDRALLAAVTKPGLLRQWIALLEEAQAPLAGIGSLPLFSETILRQVEQEPGRQRLIVSMQSLSGLRQTYFHGGKFRISRLARLPRHGVEAAAPWIKEEVEKTRRYLESVRLLAATESLQAYFLLSGGLLRELRDEYTRGEPDAVTAVFCDLNDLLRAAGDGRTVDAPFADRYFVHRLLQAGPVNSYASATERRHYLLRRLRGGMRAGGGLLLLAGVLWGWVHLVGGLAYRQGALIAQQEAERYEHRYRLARRDLPPTPTAPAELQAAVELTAGLRAGKSAPLEMIRALSVGLRGYPSIQPRKLSWTAATEPGLPPTRQAAAEPVFTPASLSMPAPASAVDAYQVATLHGVITPFNGDYRAAIKLIDSFAATLREQEDIHAAQILSLPLDVSPSSNLRGDAREHAPRRKDAAEFSLRVVLGARANE